jgi:thiopeptide-type bacteriocin biosynthesis protein
MQYTWLSAHLFFTGNLQGLLNTLVTPLLQRNGYSAFFIRYWEGGPHIRLRLRIREDEIPAVKALLQADADQFFKEHNNGSLQYVPYQPEIQRYGNAQSITLAEEQFIASSAYVLHHIQQAPSWDDSVALLHALRLNLALLFALQEGEEFTLQTCDTFIRSWLPRLYDPSASKHAQEQYYRSQMQSRFDTHAAALTAATTYLWENMERGVAEEALQTFVIQHLAIFRQYRNYHFQPDRYAGIIGSFLHMGHNRLGISNLDEAYIMFFTLKCLEHIYAHMGA